MKAITPYIALLIIAAIITSFMLQTTPVRVNFTGNVYNKAKEYPLAEASITLYHYNNGKEKSTDFATTTNGQGAYNLDYYYANKKEEQILICATDVVLAKSANCNSKCKIFTFKPTDKPTDIAKGYDFFLCTKTAGK